MTTNSEWLNELAKSDPKALQAWFDAEHVEGTNGIDGETNGIADGSPLVDELGEITHEVSELMKKQPYTFDVNDVQGSIRLAGRYIDELTEEIAKRDKGIERLKNQRDEARAQLENLARDLDESEKLREELRAKFGKACDYANELYALMDL